MLGQIKLLILFLVFYIPNIASAFKNDSLSVSIENDSSKIGGPGTDDNYSSGIKITYFYADEDSPSWGEFLQPALDFVKYTNKPSLLNFSFFIAHQIYTPTDTSSRNLILNDRPYAAWLYLNFNSLIRYTTHLDIWSIGIGIIGPAAFGEELQRQFHYLIDEPQSNGWQHQLDNELGLFVSYLRQDRLVEVGSNTMTYIDISSLVGATLGNVLIDLKAGFLLRAGYSLDQTFAPSEISGTGASGLPSFADYSTSNFSFYLFAGVKGLSIAHNIFLDGNTFYKSHRVDRIPFVGETEFGLVTRIRRIAIEWRRVWRGPEFKERKKGHSFGTLTLTFSKLF